MRCVALVALAGCGFSGPGLVDGSGAPEGPTVDTDHDGVADDHDNCPMIFNSDQHDEDGDGVGDLCDPCPQIANEDRRDTDNDKIPDVCDPHPSVNGDHLAFFDGFAGGKLSPMWMLVQGTAGDFIVGDDVLTITPSMGNQADIILFGTNTPRHAIELGADLPEHALAPAPYFTAVVDARLDLTHFVECGVRTDTAAREMQRIDGATFNSIAADPNPTDPVALPGTLRLLTVFGPSNQDCYLPNGGTKHDLSATLQLTAANFVGIRVGGSQVFRVRYAAIYTY